MKKLATIIAVSAGLLTFKAADAQIGLHVSFNFGNVVATRPVPVQYQYPADDNCNDYYYLPEVEAYYSIPQHCYYYMDGNRWISNTYLPGNYRNMDWRSFRHYEVREVRPYMHHDMYRERFGGFARRSDWNYANNDRRGGYGDYRGGFDQPNRGDDDRYNRGQWRDRSRDNFQNRGNQSNYPQNGYNPYGQQQGDYNQNRGNDNRGNWGGNQNGGQYQNNNGQGRGGNDNRGKWNGNSNNQPVNNNGNRLSNDHFVSNDSPRGGLRPGRIF
ncbi:hypothetical protein [Mucilaginibacter sp. KACC 22063]|uniref:hypothetical protein n=1 Tax=Mucilaginibacter sp. KACC 22063 TaxID=3025666 RepID=UPI002366381A|nr:hypothetical protein [Mucilaginibacter sp. KACC 22063]WDF53970.1 hypothetical protein PQ461_13565 [Mucilaginibacter sp. KACC 22063]